MHDPKRFVLSGMTAVLLVLGALLQSGSAVRAEEGEPPSQTNFEFHNRDTGEALPLLAMKSRTTIQGPVAMTDIEYIAENKNEKQIEVAVTFEVPPGTVLTKFGYYYGDRFIPGKMYDKNEAWKIYTAVTSRGRDPGIMDRPSATNYHAQIFPVAPKRDLRVHVTLVQMLQTEKAALRFELPLVQGTAYLGGWNQRAFDVEALVTINGQRAIPIEATAETADKKDQLDHASAGDKSAGDKEVIRFHRNYTPHKNLMVRMPFANKGTHIATYSRMVNDHEGYYALTIASPKNLQSVRAQLKSNGLTGMSMPTLFGNVDAYGDMHIVGRYTKPGTVRVRLRDENGARITVPLHLSDAHVKTVRENPAAALWADKRIALLQNATRRNFQSDIVSLSQRFMVVSNFTALLAIPQEELDYYRKVLAKQKVETNTQTMGGGGDPYIAVHAPEDAAQVVALFPDGDIRNLHWNTEKQVWDGRFDIPFGTPEGEYKVTILVVHKNGKRTPFTLVYQNRLTGPSVNANSLQTLTAERGKPVLVSVQGEHIQRVTALTPWGERVPLNDAGQGNWSGEINVPAAQAMGNTSITLILLDGAHNSTEVTLDLDIQ